MKLKLIDDFKKFAIRGNVIDMAVGVIIGSAFGKIISSAVSDIIMPPIGILISGVDFKDLSIEIKSGVLDAAGNVMVEPVVLSYGRFIQTIVDFAIIAFVIFMVIKMINKLFEKPEEKPAVQAPAELPTDIKLLTEIRDLLAKNN